MNFGLSREQELLRESVASFTARLLAMARVREVAEEKGTDGYRACWTQLAEQGLTGLLIAEASEGAGLGLLDAVVAAQELGRAVTPVSFHSSCVAAPLWIAAAAPGEVCDRLLRDVAAGERLVAAALDEAPDGHTGESAPSVREGRLHGQLRFVPDAAEADALLLRADGCTWLVPRHAAGLEITPIHAVDRTRRLGHVRFDGVACDPSKPLAPAGEGGPARSLAPLEAGLAIPLAPVGEGGMRRIVDAARIALAADALGACYQAIRSAVEYSLGRQQFGRVIGSFQAVKHLCAEMIADVDPIQSLLWYAAWAWDREQPDAGRLAALLKSHVAEVGASVAAKATQVYGGMGFTWECDMHFWFKRIAYARQILGTPETLRAHAAAEAD